MIRGIAIVHVRQDVPSLPRAHHHDGIQPDERKSPMSSPSPMAVVLRLRLAEANAESVLWFDTSSEAEGPEIAPVVRKLSKPPMKF